MADTSITAANFIPSANATLKTRIAGVALTAGNTLYADTANGNVRKLADNNAAAPANTFSGFACNAAAVGQPVTECTADPDLVVGATLVQGTTYVLSATAGKMCPIADIATGSKVIILGTAKSATVLDYDPRDSEIVSA